MKLHTCPAGHMTTITPCRVCKANKAQAVRRENRRLEKENKELRRQVENPQQVIQAGRAF